ncbi:hypothetical protein [Rhodococcus sp. SORGH_AS_0301]|uniref:hypothetical protein n=1 Tax=Rhodococcus sp. SORGH_AS_0301 TaxID=3041780 RepID=UPI00278A0CAD|nr:hypothetical protein [Rhodococcus sp. SORGH_AS_0301]MDQ1178671.1 hypothetical protein [Rhodococcus sp. SORGH_AS_0301]
MTRVDWAGHARRLREHAEADAAARTAETGQPHRPDQNVLRVASSCDTAAYSPDRPNPRLERLVADTLAATPAPRPHTGNFDLSASAGHRPDVPRR